MKKIFMLVAAAIFVQADFIDVGNGELFYKTMGRGTPLIVLHGGPGLSQEYLLPQMEKLAENHFVIFYDQRGCGQSTGEISPETINIETYVNDLEKVRKAFNLEKVSILGHSFGSFLAMNYVIAHPENVDKLILSNSIPAEASDVMLFMNEWMRRIAPYQKEFDEIHASLGYVECDPDVVERLHRLIMRTYLADPEKINQVNLRTTQTAALRGEEVHKLMTAPLFFGELNLYPALQKLQMQALIIHGDCDIIPPVIAEHLHENINGSKYVLIENCGHLPYVEAPDRYFAEIEAFLGN